ncbi:MAG: HyaD/HybD family hydrogenase maturation endopeptidase [Desulfovibrionales bacterium]
MYATKKQILVLGVGNILYADEGVGVKVVNMLQQKYEFSDNVALCDGGTLGMRLMGPIMEADLLIVVDAVLGDGPPGTIYRLIGDDLRKSLAFKNSLHQTDLVDTLIYCDMLGSRPDALVVGIEPDDYQSVSLDISPVLQGRLEDFEAAVLEEIQDFGGWYRANTLQREEKVCAWPFQSKSCT